MELRNAVLEVRQNGMLTLARLERGPGYVVVKKQTAKTLTGLLHELNHIFVHHKNYLEVSI